MQTVLVKVRAFQTPCPVLNLIDLTSHLKDQNVFEEEDGFIESVLAIVELILKLIDFKHAEGIFWSLEKGSLVH